MLEREDKDASNTRRFKPRFVPIQMPTSCFPTTHTKERSGNNSAVTLTQSRKGLPTAARPPDTPSSTGCTASPRTGHSYPRKSFPTGCHHANLPKTYECVQTLSASQIQGQAEPKILPILTMGLLGDTQASLKMGCPKPNRTEMQWDVTASPGRGRTLPPQNESRVHRAARGRTQTDTHGK